MLKRTIVLAALAGFVLALAPAARADLIGPGGIVSPTGINPETGADWAPGDIYHLVFVTSTTTNASSDDIAHYNTHVNSAADNSPLVGVADVEWFALVSTELADAEDNAPISAPVYLLDGITKVADGYDDMWNGDISHSINYSEIAGAWVPPTNYMLYRVWTGSLLDGTAKAGATLGIGSPMTGRFAKSDGGWFNWSGTNKAYQLSTYALSEPLTVIPEPATMLLLGLGGLGVIIRRRRS